MKEYCLVLVDSFGRLLLVEYFTIVTKLATT